MNNSVVIVVLALLLQMRPDNPRPEIRLADLELRVHELINEERTKEKRRPLEMDNRLSEIARKHSQDMADRRFFDHLTPDGRTPNDRARAARYTCRKVKGNTVREGVAENIFQNNLYNFIRLRGNDTFYNWNTMEEIAETTVKGWMSSPGHRRNILEADYERSGIGIAVGPDDKVYITQIFC